MKKIVTPFVVGAVIAFVLTSCGENKKKLLARTWKIENVKISKEVPEEQKAIFEQMLAEMKQYLRLTYKADGSYVATFMGKSSEGKWELSKDQKEMTAIDEHGRPIKYKIVSLTKDRFEYVTDDSAQPVTFILVPGDSLPNTPMPEHSMMEPETSEMPDSVVAK